MSLLNFHFPLNLFQVSKKLRFCIKAAHPGGLRNAKQFFLQEQSLILFVRHVLFQPGLHLIQSQNNPFDGIALQEPWSQPSKAGQSLAAICLLYPPTSFLICLT